MPVKAAKSFWRPCHCPKLPLPTPKTRPAKNPRSEIIQGAVLGQLRNLRQHERRHGEVRERQGRQEPRFAE